MPAKFHLEAYVSKQGFPDLTQIWALGQGRGRDQGWASLRPSVEFSEQLVTANDPSMPGLALAWPWPCQGAF